MRRQQRDDRRAALDALVAAQDGLVTARQLRELGFDSGSTAHRIKGSGIWRRLLPGVYLTHRGDPSDRQRRLAALLYAGHPCVLTGLSALAIHGSRVARRHERDAVLVLVPHHRQRSSTGFVTIERTTRWPTGLDRGGLALAPPARAALDAARRMTSLDDVRALLSDVVQTGLAPLEELGRELRESQRRGTRLARLALEALGAGTRSAPEATLRDIWLASGIAEPLWNPTLRSAGTFLARPDAYVPATGLAVEVESREFHYSDADWQRTIERQARLTAQGIVVIQVTPQRLRTGATEFMERIRSTLAALGTRQLPHVSVTPHV